MLKCYVVEPELEKRRRFCQIGSKSHALEAFWRGLEQPGSSSGGFLEKVLAVLGGLGRSLGRLRRVAGLPKLICTRMRSVGSQVGLNVGTEKYVF